jgi:hypothetical protein
MFNGKLLNYKRVNFIHTPLNHYKIPLTIIYQLYQVISINHHPTSHQPGISPQLLDQGWFFCVRVESIRPGTWQEPGGRMSRKMLGFSREN